MSFISSCWKPPPVTDPRSWSSEPTSWSRWMQICPRDVGPCVKCGVPVYEGQSRLMFCIDWNLLILLRNSIHVELVNMFWYVWCLMDCSCRVFFVEHHCYIVGFLKISFAIFRQKALWILDKLSWLFILRWNVQTFWSHAFTGTPLERHAFQAHRSRLYGRACSGCCDCLSDIALIATALNCWRVALCQQDWDGSSH